MFNWSRTQGWLKFFHHKRSACGNITAMATISTQLRKFKEPTKEEYSRYFFSLPPEEWIKDGSSKDTETEKMDISVVLSLADHNIEDSYVSNDVVFDSDGLPDPDLMHL